MPSPNERTALQLRLTRKSRPAENVVMLQLAGIDGEELPRWEPGAHLQLRLPSGLSRQYSLCGDPATRTAYTVCVLRENDGRGGSVEVHDQLQVGDELDSTEPRNHFPLVDGLDYLLLAGGIGITPLKAMLEELDRRAASWRLVYGGRSRRSMAFADELVRSHPDKVTLLPQDETGPPDLEQIVGSVSADTRLYCCGPPSMLAAVTEASATAGLTERLHLERFTAGGDASETSGDSNFEVELRESGITVTVSAEQNLLEAIRAELPSLDFSCAEGYCGTCETRVLEGQPDHRGTLMSPEEHDDEGTMLICVGRARSPTLVLDL